MITQTVTITQNTTPNIIIGRRGTYETEQVVFDVSWLKDTYGEGTAELLVKRPPDTTAYPVTATLDGSTLTWVVSDTDTSYKGHGECEIYWYVNGGLAKSCICGITILRDIGESSSTAPNPWKPWVDEQVEHIDDAVDYVESVADDITLVSVVNDILTFTQRSDET